MGNSTEVEEMMKIIKEGYREERKAPDIECPICGNILVKKKIPGTGLCYVHEDYGKGTAVCKALFTSKKEIKKMAEEITCKEDQEKMLDKEICLKEENEEIDECLSIEDDEELKKDSLKERNKTKVKRIDISKIPIKEKEDEKSIEREKRAVIIRHETTKYVNMENEKEEEKMVEEYGKTQLLKEEIAVINMPKLVNKDTGEIIEIEKPVFRIGKQENFDLRILENPVISRKHAEISLKNGTCYVKDLGSLNGTFINGLKLPPDTEVEIKDGQILKIANEEFIFERN